MYTERQIYRTDFHTLTSVIKNPNITGFIAFLNNGQKRYVSIQVEPELKIFNLLVQLKIDLDDIKYIQVGYTFEPEINLGPDISYDPPFKLDQDPILEPGKYLVNFINPDMERDYAIYEVYSAEGDPTASMKGLFHFDLDGYMMLTAKKLQG